MINPDYVWRMAKEIQRERIEEAGRERLSRRLQRADGWWRPAVRWQSLVSESPAERRAS